MKEKWKGGEIRYSEKWDERDEMWTTPYIVRG